MATYYVSCINKPNRLDRHSRILGIGGRSGLMQLTPWYMFSEEVINRIDSGMDSFVVNVPGSPPVLVKVSRGPSGIADLTTSADSIVGNNLLSLPQCPGT